MNVPRGALAESVGYPIERILRFEAQAVVLFDSDGKVHVAGGKPADLPPLNGKEEMPCSDDIHPNANVCAVDSDGRLQWTVAPQVSARSDARYTETGIDLEPPGDDDVWVRSSDGRVHRSGRRDDVV